MVQGVHWIYKCWRDIKLDLIVVQKGTVIAIEGEDASGDVQGQDNRQKAQRKMQGRAVFLLPSSSIPPLVSNRTYDGITYEFRNKRQQINSGHFRNSHTNFRDPGMSLGNYQKPIDLHLRVTQILSALHWHSGDSALWKPLSRFKSIILCHHRLYPFSYHFLWIYCHFPPQKYFTLDPEKTSFLASPVLEGLLPPRVPWTWRLVPLPLS